MDNVSIRRPVSIPNRRRPVSEYALQMIKNCTNSSLDNNNGDDESVIRFKGENIVNYELDMPLRTTYEYKNPKVSASLQAVLAEAMQIEDDIDISDQVNIFSKLKVSIN